MVRSTIQKPPVGGFCAWLLLSAGMHCQNSAVRCSLDTRTHLMVAARQGLEPQFPGPKPGVLPLDDRAIILRVDNTINPTRTFLVQGESFHRDGIILCSMERTHSFVIGEHYHIYNRGVNKNKIFFHASDWKHFHRLLYTRNSTERIDSTRVKGLPLHTFYNYLFWCI